MPLLLLFLLLLIPSVVHAADKPVLIWGFAQGCEPLPEADVSVRLKLQDFAYKATVVDGIEKYLGCEPEQCAAILRSSCPAVSGLLLGGTIYRGKVLRTRLWLYDLEKNRVAYQDDYSQFSDVLSTVGTQAGQLLDQPDWDNTPTATPFYCQGSARNTPAPAAASGEAPKRVYYAVQAERGLKSGLTTALRQIVAEAGREAVAVSARQEAETYTLGVLRRITGKTAGSQVLGVELLEGQKIRLWLFDSTTGQLAGPVQPLDCAGCSRDDMVAKLRTEATALLNSCIGDSCGQKSELTRAPKEACEPLPLSQCGGRAAALKIASKGAETPKGPTVSPEIARLVKGLTWGAFAVTAGTAAALFAANYTSAGRQDLGKFDAYDSLLAPAGATTGAAVLMLGVAIPLTVVVNRASASAEGRKATTTATLGGLQCPQ